MSVHWGGSHGREPFVWSPLRKALQALGACRCEEFEGRCRGAGDPPSVAAAAPPLGPWRTDRTAT